MHLQPLINSGRRDLQQPYQTRSSHHRTRFSNGTTFIPHNFHLCDHPLHTLLSPITPSYQTQPPKNHQRLHPVRHLKILPVRLFHPDSNRVETLIRNFLQYLSTTLRPQTQKSAPRPKLPRPPKTHLPTWKRRLLRGTNFVPSGKSSRNRFMVRPFGSTSTVVLRQCCRLRFARPPKVVLSGESVA